MTASGDSVPVTKAWALIILLVVGVGACPSKLPFHDYAREPDPRGGEPILGVGDAVSINVWEQRDLSTEAVIRADGMITMPLVGNLKAAGETPSALTIKLKQRLGDFVKIRERSP
jgi:polysaccharide export outer membrane protein